MLEILFMITIFGGLILIAIGVSFLSQCIDPVDYNNMYDKDILDQNPLVKLGSKYFHWRPKGAVVLTKSKWAEIENNIAAEIEETKRLARISGYNEAVKVFRAKISEKKEKASFPTNPYKILCVNSNDSDNIIALSYEKMMLLYSPDRFKDLDESFVELAKLRQDQIRKAYNKLQAGVGKGTF